MAPPEVNLGWGDPPPDPKEPAGPEPGEFSYENLPAAASGGHSNWFLTALGAVGKFFAFLLRHWRWDGLAVVLGIAYGAYLATGDRSILLWRVAGIGFSIWFMVVLWTIPGPKDPIPVTPPPGTGWSPEGDGGEGILAATAAANEARAKARWPLWWPLRPVKGTFGARAGRFFRKAGRFFQTAWAAVWAWLVAAWQLVAGLALLGVGVVWEIGKVIFTKPIDRSRPWDRRKPSWVVIGVLAALIPFSVLVGMNLPRAGSAGKEMLAGMSQFSLPALPKLPEVKFRWPTWGATPSQVAANPSAQPAPTVKPPLPPTAFGNGFRRKPDPDPEPPVVAVAPVPLRSVRDVKIATDWVTAETERLRRETDAAVAKTRATSEARKAAEAKALAATRQRTAEARRATPAHLPTVLIAEVPQSGHARVSGTKFPASGKSVPDTMTQLRTELARAQKERDEAQAKATELAARPVPTPQIVTRTATVGVPVKVVQTKIVTKTVRGPVRTVRQTVEVKVPVVKTVTKTKTVVRTVRIAGPTNVVKVNGPTRIVTKTVKVPVPGPERVVYRDRPGAPKQETGSPIRSGMTKNASAKKTAVVVKTQQPAAQTTTAGTDPYGGDPYDY